MRWTRPSSNQQIDAVRNFENVGWPISIREYIKMRNALTAALDEKRNVVRTQISQAYNDTFDLLERSAEEQGVDKIHLVGS
jgi:hypothetical protein